jgi:CHAT domain
VHASSRSADASSSFKLPFNELELENFVLRVSRSRGRRRIDSSALGDAKRFGGALFKAVFREDVGGLYHEALSAARSKGSGLRITLCLSGSPELMDVPWEYLFDEPDFLAASAFTPVVRYLDLPRPHRPLRVSPPLRILGVVSNPNDFQPLDVEREQANLERALSGLTASGSVEVQWLARPTLGALLRRLQAETFHVLHFVGHGSYDEGAEEGFLLFEDDSGRARPVSGDKLGMIVHDFTSLRLAILNACEGARTARTDPFAGVAQALVQRDIPAVIAMQFEISDEAAISFAQGFYDALAAGSPADASLAAARLAMLAEQSDDIEWGTPVLFMRVPDGRLFDVGKRRVPSHAVTEVLPPSPASSEGAGSEAEDNGFERRDQVAEHADGASTAAADLSTTDPEPGITETPEAPGGSTVPADGSGHRINYHATRRGRRLSWLLVPIAAGVAAVVLILSAGTSDSNANVARAWLRAFDQRNFTQAVKYWRTPAEWTGLKNGNNFFGSIVELKTYLRQRSACHKVLYQVVVDPARPNLVQLRVTIDRSLPGLPAGECHAIGQIWYENYSLVAGRIQAVRIHDAAGGQTAAHHQAGTKATKGTSSPAGGPSASTGSAGPSPITSASPTATSGAGVSTGSGSAPSQTATSSSTATAPTISAPLEAPPTPQSG